MAILTRTFLDKTNTLVSNDSINLGLNPIIELYYGTPYSRCVVHFDTDRLRSLVDDGTYPDVSRLRHRLVMANVGSLSTPYRSVYNKYNGAERAKSFDLRFFTIDRPWDRGGGFDYLMDGYDTVNRIYSTQGSNWERCRTDERWSAGGIYDEEELEARTFCTQHFDIGTESIDIDITDVVNRMILGQEPNNGIGIAFAEGFERQSLKHVRYVGFFGNMTNTFFKPYVETRYDDGISDDRDRFYLGRDNRLYFYAKEGDEFVNLDRCPRCMVGDRVMPVIQATKGVYYVNAMLDAGRYEPGVMMYDRWYDISYKGRSLDDVELQFVTRPAEEHFTFGLPFKTRKHDEYTVDVSGIKYSETIQRGDVRKVSISPRIARTADQAARYGRVEYRIYGNDVERESDVVSWAPAEMGYGECYFYLDTADLPEGRMAMDVKVMGGGETAVVRKAVEFSVYDNERDLKF